MAGAAPARTLVRGQERCEQIKPVMGSGTCEAALKVGEVEREGDEQW